MEDSSRVWVELSLTAGPEAIDAIAEVFRANGANGIAAESAIVPGADDGVIETSGTSRIAAYLPADDQCEARIQAIEHALWHLSAFDLAPMTPLSRKQVHEEDWANAWKEHFHPLRIGRHVVIKPTWREFEAETSDIVIQLDPGMAFGTGLHPTTAMMIESLEMAVAPGMRVLDLGTGSGILAIEAALLGATSVIALDVDSVAAFVAAENVALNNVASVVKVDHGPINAAFGYFDLIAANIIASVIAAVLPDMKARLNPGGRIIASGIIEEKAVLVEEAVSQCQLRIVETRVSGDWLCLWIGE